MYPSQLASNNLQSPQSPEELAEALSAASGAGRTITLNGNSSKLRMAAPPVPSDVTITTAGLRRVLSYEPKDLTISVEAGMPYADLSRTLAANRQMVPLDPPFAGSASVGGILGANSSGPRRRLYGSARDLVIGMKFATLEGKLVQSGGMVVKNVAGLDMGKLLIGSFGTLAAIATVNFKLQPMPEVERLFPLVFQTLDAAAAARRTILAGVLLPSMIDLLNPKAAALVGLSGYVLAVQAGGNSAAIARYQRELSAMGSLADADAGLFERIQELTAAHLAANPDGAVVRISCSLSEVPGVVASLDVPVVARAGNGVCYAYFDRSQDAAQAVRANRKAIMEFGPGQPTADQELWPTPGPDLELMKRIKQMFDPRHLLNRGRFFRHI
ncbi:MAG: FAD-binding oxidoreductase [Bryobacteraceae bacterium]